MINSCSPNKKRSWEGELIEEKGLYYLSTQDLYLNVYYSDRLLRYNLTNSKGDTIIKSINNPSILHRWYVYFDDKQNLWVYGSDNGGYVWCKNDEGYYCQYNIIIHYDKLDQAPVEIRDELSKSLEYPIKEYKKIKKKTLERFERNSNEGYENIITSPEGIICPTTADSL
jgi:hypothetical protein